MIWQDVHFSHPVHIRTSKEPKRWTDLTAPGRSVFLSCFWIRKRWWDGLPLPEAPSRFTIYAEGRLLFQGTAGDGARGAKAAGLNDVVPVLRTLLNGQPVVLFPTETLRLFSKPWRCP